MEEHLTVLVGVNFLHANSFLIDYHTFGNLCLELNVIFRYEPRVARISFLPHKYSKYKLQPNRTGRVPQHSLKLAKVSFTFFKNLFSSSSNEVRHLANIVSRDARSVVFRNIKYIENISGVSPWRTTSQETLKNIENVPTPPNNEWRMPFLLKLLETRRKMSQSLENTTRMSEMIDSLCNT